MQLPRSSRTIFRLKISSTTKSANCWSNIAITCAVKASRYQEMFRRVKNQMLAQKKVIRAAGRDTGGAMKLSRDKVNDLSHKIVDSIRKSRDFRVRKDANEVRLAIVKKITDLLQMEERIDKAARAKIRSQKREIAEGGEEYDLLHKRYYAEELKKFGIDLAHG